MRTKLIGIVLAMSFAASSAALAESYTCKNVLGWGTWKFEVLETTTGSFQVIKTLRVYYSGYSAVEKRFGDWQGRGVWHVASPGRIDNGRTLIFIPLQDSPGEYECQCRQQTWTRWGCHPNRGEYFEIECSLF